MEGNSRTDRHAVLIVTYNRAALLRECVEKNGSGWARGLTPVAHR